MKKALISPNEVPQYISSWVDHQTPVFSPVPNSARVADVADSAFPVAAPLFWVDCDNDVTADTVYYDTSDSTLKAVPESAPRPTAENQPQSNGSNPL